MTISNLEELDCVTCGICCTDKTDINLRVYATNDEWGKIPDLYKSEFEWQKNHMGFKPCKGGFCCKALSGVIGESVKCEIYSTRPDKCKQFEKGSARCLEMRENNMVGFL